MAIIATVAAFAKRIPSTAKGGTGDSPAPDITPDGRYLVFPSSTLLGDETAQVAEAVFVKDLQTGQVTRIFGGRDPVGSA